MKLLLWGVLLCGVVPVVFAGNTTIFFEDFNTNPLSNNWTLIAAVNYSSKSAQYVSAPQSIGLTAAQTNKFTWHYPALNTSNCSYVYVSLWNRDDDLDANDIQLYYNNSSGNWNSISDLNEATEDAWLQRNYSTSNAQYMHSNFAIRFGGSTATGENHWLDDLSVVCETTDAPAGTCTGTSNCTVDCSTNPTISSDVNVGGYTITFTGSGTARVTSAITNWTQFIWSNSCNVELVGGRI